ncbi:MAG: cysteine-rich VLP domain-containing protein [Lachnospiraceae bacterium]|nr:cysteine-rich VLP domain-containing protein [Lachnospiraceae bacterium]
MVERGSRYGPPLPRKPDGSLYEMSEAQRGEAAKLIARECCNYHKGNCILLDDGDERTCPQRISYAASCRWFRNAVLPLNPELEADIFKDRDRKRCERCGARFVPGSNRSRFCPDCAAKVRREKERERKWNKRHMSAFRG